MGKNSDNENVVASYKGMLLHGNGRKLICTLEMLYTKGKE